MSVKSKSEGLHQKYEVVKLDNPQKLIDAIVLEFDDPIARIGIKAWAEAMFLHGYHKVGIEVLEKLNTIEVGE